MVASPKDEGTARLRSDDRLEGSVMSQLTLAMNLIVRPFGDQHAKRLDLSLTEWRVVKALAAEPERSGEEVARASFTERMAVSRALRRLESQGRAVRRKAPEDRKKNLWRLTEDGWAVFDEMAPLAEAHQRAMLSRLSAAERAAFADALARIIEGAS